MATHEITVEMNLKKIIAESKEVARALNEFADNLEQIEKRYADEKESHNTDIENSATKHWIFERVESISDSQDLWNFEFRCPKCFNLLSFVRQDMYPFSENRKCPVCGEPLIVDPEDMLK